jgi:hypothetical protein
MNSFQVLEHELGRYVSAAADVLVEPDLSSHTWIEFYRAPEIIARGIDAGAKAVPEIERVLAERLHAFAPPPPPLGRTDRDDDFDVVAQRPT